MINLLEKILLSDNVCENFHNTLAQNKEFSAWCNKLLPQIQDCVMSQNNPWHVYNVLDHILHSVENINQLSKDLPYQTRKNLAMTMLLHDIGKPQCHIRRMKQGVMIDSFFNHNIASRDIAKNFLKNVEYPTKDALLIENLIFKHDIFMFIDLTPTTNPYHRPLSKELIIKEIMEFENLGIEGYDAMKCLLLVGRADSLAQNPKATQKSLQLLTAMDKMLEEVVKEQERE